MERHPELHFEIGGIINKANDIWIMIKDSDDSGWEKKLYDCSSDDQNIGPIELLTRIKEKHDWTLKQIGYLQYAFVEKENIIFQWDDLFGFVIVTNDETELSIIEALVRN